MHDPGCTAEFSENNLCNCRYALVNKNHHDFIRLWTLSGYASNYKKSDWTNALSQLENSGTIMLSSYYDAKKDAFQWLLDKGFNLSSVCGRTFDDLSLVKNKKAFLYVGAGIADDDYRVGFAIEVVMGGGVVAGEVMQSRDVEPLLQKYTTEAASPIKTMMEVLLNESIAFDKIQNLFAH